MNEFTCPIVNVLEFVCVGNHELTFDVRYGLDVLTVNTFERVLVSIWNTEWIPTSFTSITDDHCSNMNARWVVAANHLARICQILSITYHNGIGRWTRCLLTCHVF